MQFKANNIGVDTGMIMIGDVDYLKDHPQRNKPENEGVVFKKVKKGRYSVAWFIPDTHNGHIKGHNETLVITSGTIFVCDPCYVIGEENNHKSWMKWLKKTDYGEDLKDDRVFIISSMGGDGVYKVYFELEYLGSK